jgi:hypothetical protein
VRAEASRTPNFTAAYMADVNALRAAGRSIVIVHTRSSHCQLTFGDGESPSGCASVIDEQLS